MAVEGLSIHLYLDHNVDSRIAVDLRQRGFDVVTAHEVGNARASDDEHLRWASFHGRTVLTFDVGDFPALAADWFFAGQTHAGIILSVPSNRLGYGELLNRLWRLLDKFTADDMVNRVEWLDDRLSSAP